MTRETQVSFGNGGGVHVPDVVPVQQLYRPWAVVHRIESTSGVHFGRTHQNVELAWMLFKVRDIVNLVPYQNPAGVKGAVLHELLPSDHPRFLALTHLFLEDYLKAP